MNKDIPILRQKISQPALLPLSSADLCLHQTLITTQTQNHALCPLPQEKARLPLRDCPSRPASHQCSPAAGGQRSGRRPRYAAASPCGGTSWRPPRAGGPASGPTGSWRGPGKGRCRALQRGRDGCGGRGPRTSLPNWASGNMQPWAWGDRKRLSAIHTLLPVTPPK